MNAAYSAASFAGSSAGSRSFTLPAKSERTQYGEPSGPTGPNGRICHTLNPRLHPDQVVWIADHAEDQVLFFAAELDRSDYPVALLEGDHLEV